MDESPPEKVLEETDLRKVPFPYLCKCMWWRGMKRREDLWGDLEHKIASVCEEVEWAEEAMKEEGCEPWVFDYWAEKLESLRPLHSMAVNRGGFGELTVVEEDRPFKEDPDDPVIRRTVASPKSLSPWLLLLAGAAVLVVITWPRGN